VLDDVVSQLKLLGPCSFLKAPLHDAASVLVHTDFDAVLHASIEDELSVETRLVTARVVFVCWVV